MKIIEIHYKNNLKLCLWSDFHGVMEFEQAAFLKPLLNTVQNYKSKQKGNKIKKQNAKVRN